MNIDQNFLFTMAKIIIEKIWLEDCAYLCFRINTRTGNTSERFREHNKTDRNRFAKHNKYHGRCKRESYILSAIGEYAAATPTIIILN